MSVEPYNNMKFVVVSQIPGTHIVNRSYNEYKQIEYMAHAPRGTDESDKKWIIRKYVYDGNRQLSTERVAIEAAWDERELGSTSYA